MDRIEKKPLGVIDSLATGFELVARRPWVLLVPIAFNLFLWFGPPVNAKPLFDQAIGLMNSTAASTPNLSADTAQGLDAFREMLQSMGESFNFLDIIALFALGLPSLTGLESLPGTLPHVPWFVIGDAGTLLGVIALSALIGIFVASIYLETIARAVRQDGQVWTFGPRVLKSYINTGVFVIVVLLGILVLFSPFLIAAVLVSLFSQGLASFVMIVGFMFALWALLYMAFALPAVFVSGANPIQAIWNSVTVFRYNSWSAMGLVLLIYLIQLGFSLLWRSLIGNTWVNLVTVAANAFLGSGLVAAAMLFYHDRFSWLTEVRERIRQQQRPLIKG